MISWTVPERYWPSFAQALAWVATQLLVWRRRTQRERRRQIFGNRFGLAALDRIERDYLAHRIMFRMQGYREYRPGGWHPKIQLLGAENIQAALAQGHGVVLWHARLVYTDLVAKKALYESGFRVSQLARPDHNISPSRFGIRVLNPIWTRIEDRFLAERVLIVNEDTRSALAILRQRLTDNRIIRIAALDTGKRTAKVDFLETKLRFATGPLHLARTTKATVLPVFTVKQENGVFVVDVQSRLTGGEDDDNESYETLCQRFARRLERFVLQYPDQFWGLPQENGL